MQQPIKDIPNIPNTPVEIKNWLLSILSYVVPIDETIKTLKQIQQTNSENNPSDISNWKLKLICSLLVLGGLKVTIYGERYKLISTTILIFFLGVFSNEFVVERCFNFSLDFLKEFLHNDPIIAILIKLLISFILAFIIHKILLDYVGYIITFLVMMYLHSRVREESWYRELSSTKFVLFYFCWIALFLVVLFFVKKLFLRALIIACYCVLGVMYAFIGGSVFLNLQTGGEYGFSIDDLREDNLSYTASASLCTVAVCFTFQFLYPYFVKK